MVRGGSINLHLCIRGRRPVDCASVLELASAFLPLRKRRHQKWRAREFDDCL